MKASTESAGQFLRLSNYQIHERALEDLLVNNRVHNGVLMAPGEIPVFMRVVSRTKEGENLFPIQAGEESKDPYVTMPKGQEFYVVFQSPSILQSSDRGTRPRILTSGLSIPRQTRPCLAATMSEDGSRTSDFSDCPYLPFHVEVLVHQGERIPVLTGRFKMRNVTDKISIVVCEGEEELRPSVILPNRLLDPRGKLADIGAIQKPREEEMSVVGMTPKKPVAAFSIDLREPKALPDPEAAAKLVKQLLKDQQ